jgi:hypothetical protein
MRYDDVGTRNRKSLFGRGIDPTTRIPHRNVVNVDPQPGGLSSGGPVGNPSWRRVRVWCSTCHGLAHGWWRSSARA